MWARKCGVPPHWPSRIKVLVQCCIVGLFGISVYRFITEADAGYLNLDAPRNEDILCMSDWPLRHDKSSWWNEEAYIDWYSYYIDPQAFIASHPCASTPTAVVNATCSTVRMPILDVQRNLGVPIGRGFEYTDDAIEIYSHILVYLAGWTWLSMVVHDVALLSPGYHNGILDLMGIKRKFPCVRRLMYLLGFHHMKKAMAGKNARVKAVWISLVPVLFIWDLLVLLVVLLPAGCFVFICYPVRLCRAQLFLVCIGCSIVGLLLTIRCLFWVAQPDTRPAYAITWEELAGSCYCGCVFRMKFSQIMAVLMIGVGMTIKAPMLALRCLKGLRRQNWASLMSVTFAVPLAVYPVEWKTPEGEPILHRKEGEPVQGELAFDPFALMDEQPNSQFTTVKLLPTPLEGPALPERKVEFSVVLDKSWGRELGASFQSCGSVLCVIGLNGGLVDAWNKRYPDLAVKVDDELVALNGDSSVTEVQIDEFLTSEAVRTLTMQFQRMVGGSGELAGPSAASFKVVGGQKEEYIGCCGFPCLKKQEIDDGGEDSAKPGGGFESDQQRPGGDNLSRSL